jgi:hypothetical protein
MKSKLPMSAWGHAILHAAALIHIRPTSYHSSSPLQLIFSKELDISHLRFLDVRCMSQLLHQNAQGWDLKEGWEYILGMNPHL